MQLVVIVKLVFEKTFCFCVIDLNWTLFQLLFVQIEFLISCKNHLIAQWENELISLSVLPVARL